MTNQEYGDKLAKLRSTAGMNTRYHQRLEARFDWIDRGVRILVAVVAVAAVVLAVPPLATAWWSFGVAAVAAALAVALNVIPVVEWAKLHGELFRSWSELRKDTLAEEHKADAVTAPDHHQLERLLELTAKAGTLDATEPFADEKLLRHCQGDEYEAEYGPNVRTSAQAKEAKRRMLAEDSAEDSAEDAAKEQTAPAAGADVV